MSDIKERILLHMNADHRTSLFDYLAYYGGIPLDILNPQHGVELVDVELDFFVLNYHKQPGQSKTARIPLDPPMTSLNDSRSRFVAMAFEAADGTHVSPYRITQVKCPTKIHEWAIILAVIFGGLGSISPVATGRFLGSRIGPFMQRHIRKIIGLVLLVHVVEYLTVLRKKLAFYRVPRSTRYKWIAYNLVTGFVALNKFGEEEKRLLEQRAKFDSKFTSKSTKSHSE